MNIENQANETNEVEKLEEAAKKYDEMMKQINEDAEKAYKEAKEASDALNYDNTLIEKIINNAIIMMKSNEVQKIVDTLKGKVDHETIAAVINLTVYASSAAAHQAILFYDELLSSKLKMDFVEIERYIQGKLIEMNALRSVVEVLSARINEVRTKLQLDSIEKN